MSSDTDVLSAAEKLGVQWSADSSLSSEHLAELRQNIFSRPEFISFRENPIFDLSGICLPKSISQTCSPSIFRFSEASCLSLGIPSDLVGKSAFAEIIYEGYRSDEVSEFRQCLAEVVQMSEFSDEYIWNALQDYGESIFPNVVVQTPNAASVLETGRYFTAHSIEAHKIRYANSYGMSAGFTSQVIAEFRRHIERAAGFPADDTSDEMHLMRPASGYFLPKNSNTARLETINEVHADGLGGFSNLPISQSCLHSTGLLRKDMSCPYGNDRIILRRSINERVKVYPGDATIDHFLKRKFYPFSSLLGGFGAQDFGDILSILTCHKLGYFPSIFLSPFQYTHGPSNREYSEALILGSFDYDDIVAVSVNTKSQSTDNVLRLSDLAKLLGMATHSFINQGPSIYIWDDFIDLDVVELGNQSMGPGWLKHIESRYGNLFPSDPGSEIHPVDVLLAALNNGVAPYVLDMDLDSFSDIALTMRNTSISAPYRP